MLMRLHWQLQPRHVLLSVLLPSSRQHAPGGDCVQPVCGPPAQRLKLRLKLRLE